MNSSELIFKNRCLLSKFYRFYIFKVQLEKPSLKNGTHFRKKGNMPFLASTSGEILLFPSSVTHHKSSKEIVFKIN